MLFAPCAGRMDLWPARVAPAVANGGAEFATQPNAFVQQVRDAFGLGRCQRLDHQQGAIGCGDQESAAVGKGDRAGAKRFANLGLG